MKSLDKSLHSPVDIQLEISACAALIKNNWLTTGLRRRNGSHDFAADEFVREAFMLGYDAEPNAINANDLNEVLHTYLCSRFDILSNQGVDDEYQYSDSITKLLSSVMVLIEKKENTINLSDAKLRVIQNKLINKFYGASELLPICFSDTISMDEATVFSHSQRDLMHVLDMFDGHDTSRVNGDGFALKSMNYAILKEYQKGISPSRSLISSIVNHAMTIREHNNACAIIAEIDTIKLSQPLCESRLSISEVLGDKSILLTHRAHHSREHKPQSAEMSFR